MDVRKNTDMGEGMVKRDRRAIHSRGGSGERVDNGLDEGWPFRRKYRRFIRDAGLASITGERRKGKLTWSP